MCAPGRCADSVGQLREPAQRAQPRSEEVLAAARHDKWRDPRESASNGVLGDCECGRSVVVADEGVLLRWRTNEDAVVQPLCLDEFELAIEVRAGEDEDDPTIGTVVL